MHTLQLTVCVFQSNNVLDPESDTVREIEICTEMSWNGSLLAVLFKHTHHPPPTIRLSG